MTASTIGDRELRSELYRGHTPRVEVDLPAALSTVHGVDHRLVPDPRGGAVLDVDHPALRPLLPYLGATGTWAVLTDPAGVEPVRRASRVAGTVVLDARGLRQGVARRSGADLVVVPVEQVDPAAAPGGPAALVELDGVPRWRIGSDLLSSADVAGFHLAPPRAPDPASETAVTMTIACALRAWEQAGRTARPLLLLRGAPTFTARRIVGALLRACRTDRLPVPVLRVDASATVVDTAVRTVVRVLGTRMQGDRPLLALDTLPASVVPSLQVLRSRPGAPEHVLVSAAGRLRTARLHGGPAVPGAELAAAGWVETAHPLVVHGFAGQPSAVVTGAHRATSSGPVSSGSDTNAVHTPASTSPR